MLIEAGNLLDKAATEIRDAELDCKSADILNIGTALAAIIEVRQSLYRYRPELKPDQTNVRVLNIDTKKEMSRIILQNHDDLARNEPEKAINRLQSFLQKSNDSHLPEIANNEIARIKSLFSM